MYKNLIETFLTIGGWPTFLCGVIGFGIGALLEAKDPWQYGVYGFIVGLGIAFFIWLDKKREEKEALNRYRKSVEPIEISELKKMLERTKTK